MIGQAQQCNRVKTDYYNPNLDTSIYLDPQQSARNKTNMENYA